MMKRIEKIKDFYDFLDEHIFSSKEDITRKTIFRGQSSTRFELRSGISRIGQAVTDKPFSILEEKRMINSYIKKSYPYIDKDLSRIEKMAIAQHHGLPTRLLDWTWNPLVAFYFAIENDKHFDEDGKIFIINTKGIKIINALDRNGNDTNFDPFKVTVPITLYEPKFIDHRIIAQSGLFSIHPNRDKGIKDRRIQEIIITGGKKGIKGKLGTALETMGIHKGNLFPGLDGTAEHIKWLYTY